MRRLVAALTVAAATLVPVAATAGEYYVTHLARDLMIAVDLENISWKGRVATVWLTSFSTDFPDDEGRKVAYMTTQTEFDCDARRWRTTTIVLFDPENEHIDTLSPTPSW